MTVPRNLLPTNLIALLRLIQPLIHNRSLLGLRTFIDAIPLSLSGRCTVSSRHKKAIHAIRALSFAYFSVLAFVKRPLPPNRLIPRSIMTHPRTSVRNGKWMLSVCLLLVTRQTRIDTSSNTRFWTKLQGSALSTPMRSNRAILHATSSAGRSLTSGICRKLFKPITALSSLTLLKPTAFIPWMLSAISLA